MVKVTVVITSRNRREICSRAVASAFDQAGCDVEVLVIDDCSDDGTADYIKQQFPNAVVERLPERMGYIVARNFAARRASSPFIVSIDDDAVFTTPHVVAAIVRSFDEARVGSVSIPFVNHFDGADHKDFVDPPDDGQKWVKPSFIGTAYAVRREVFLRLGGFQEKLYHWGEEAEFCQRLFAAGYVVAAGRSDIIRHYPKGVGKYSRQVNRYIYRNFLFSAYLNAPAKYVAPIFGIGIARSLLLRPSALPTGLEGLAMAASAMWKHRRLRQPLWAASYRAWIDLRNAKFLPLEKVEQGLPPLAV